MKRETEKEGGEGGEGAVEKSDSPIEKGMVLCFFRVMSPVRYLSGSNCSGFSNTWGS
mgnify:CR=1 FL=1